MVKDNLIQLADIEYKKENYEAVIDLYKKYLKKHSKDYVKYNLVGFFYTKIDQYENFDEQLYYFKKALEIKPDYLAAIRNIAFAYKRQGDYDKALYFFEKILDSNPTYDDYFAYACLKLRLGDFENGWRYYETRFFKSFGQVEYPNLNKPRWMGEDLKDKILLVHYEQGFGDTIQFFRYVKHIKPLVKKIIFVVQPQMVELLKLNDTEIEVIAQPKSYDDIEFDYHIPLLSIPFAIQAKKEELPLVENYIQADEAKVQKYKKEFFNNDCFKIGICWHGAPGGNIKRNIPVKIFGQLNNLENVKLYSFQKSPSNKDYEKLDLVDLRDTFNDFSDTAAAMANVDLFVTSDNSVFNLAGAMGKKTFLLLNKDSEWRWFLDDKTTPWYKNVEIFKKETETQNWSVPMKNLIANINSHMV